MLSGHWNGKYIAPVKIQLPIIYYNMRWNCIHINLKITVVYSL